MSEMRNEDGTVNYTMPVRLETDKGWKTIPRTSLGALRYMKENCECGRYRYSFSGNNCQHYGCELYRNDFQRQQGLYNEAKERGEAE
jgi:hypothetical protein